MIFLVDPLHFTNSEQFGINIYTIINMSRMNNSLILEPHKTEGSDSAGSLQTQPTARALLTMQQKGQVGPEP